MIGDETQTRFIGYGAMLMESFVAIMALIAACVLEPGVYFAMNSAPALIGVDARFRRAGDLLLGIRGHAGGACATSRARSARRPFCRAPAARRRSPSAWRKFSRPPSAARRAMAFWYHFAILFEALFILTTIDAGTRVARFMIQDLVGTFVAVLQATRGAWIPNLARHRARRDRLGLFSLSGRRSIRSAASTRCGRCSASPIRCSRRSR